MILILLAFIASMIQAPMAATSASQLSLAPARTIAEVDTSRIKGDLVRLAWMPDGSQFYLQSIERDKNGNVKATHHYTLAPSAKDMRAADQEPEWAKAYWTWKSAQASPGAATFKIDVSSRQETRRATATPTGGALAKGGSADPTLGTTVEDAASASNQAQVQNIYALTVKGETIGEWVNEAVVPGVNFTWAPSPLALMIFVKRDGGPLVAIDQSGRRSELQGAKNALLPAWSSDGARLAWLEKKDRRKFDLKVAEFVAR